MLGEDFNLYWLAVGSRCFMVKGENLDEFTLSSNWQQFVIFLFLSLVQECKEIGYLIAPRDPQSQIEIH